MSKIFVTKSMLPSYEDYINEIRSIWDSSVLTNMGEKYQMLEKELKEYMNVENISLFTNGHNALELILEAYDFPEGSEVITTPFTFISTTNAIARCKLKPVFCDINEEDYTIDVNKIEELITDKTVAILPVHVYGNICDVDSIGEIAKKHNLKVIYDAAHAMGIKYRGEGIGNFGDANMFSFHATKVFNTIEGGAITTKDKQLLDKANALRNFGMLDPENIPYIGGNAKMNEFSAAMGLCNLRLLDKMIKNREAVVNEYIQKLKNVKGLVLNKIQDNVEQNYAYFPICIKKEEFGISRDELIEILNKEDIYPRKYFYPISNMAQCYADSYDANDTPIAKRISEEVLTLPLYADLALEDVDRICDVIINAKRDY